MPGLSKEGWRDRNSVIKVGKAAASNLMAVVCGEQKEIIATLINDVTISLAKAFTTFLVPKLIIVTTSKQDKQKIRL